MPPLQTDIPARRTPGDPGARRPPRAGWLPYVALVAATGAVLVAILVLNGGKLVYTLDDPYIHLALAENIARGTYGVNPGEASAPSSSILYPLLFVPFTGFALVEWLPLALALVASLGTVFLWGRIAGWALDPAAGGRAAGGDAAPASRAGGVVAPAVVTLLVFATNLVGVMFTGMEHSLQLLATALLVWGLVVERSGEGSPRADEPGEGGAGAGPSGPAPARPAPWWLWAAIVVGPLLRYENLALSVPAVAYLFVRGHRRGSLLTLLALATGIGGFSLFLLAIGHGPLPSSVVLKSAAAGSGADPATLLDTFIGNLFLRQGALLALLGALFLGAAASAGGAGGRTGVLTRTDRRFAAWIGSAILLHMLVGEFGWFERYELYVWSAALLSALVVFRAPLRRWCATMGPGPAVAGAAAVAFVLGAPYLYATLQSPLGSSNIYQQHYQMHRFATEYWDAPVAVTDLGWVAFRNDRYVLDLWGLAHRGAAEARLRGDASWAGELTRAHGVRLAMVYGDWFTPPPPGWTPVAEMRLGRRRLTPAGDPVTFFSVDPGDPAVVRALLGAFAPTLPPGVELEMLEGGQQRQSPPEGS